MLDLNRHPASIILLKSCQTAKVFASTHGSFVEMVEHGKDGLFGPTKGPVHGEHTILSLSGQIERYNFFSVSLLFIKAAAYVMLIVTMLS
jgi:hypothetical protein